MNALHAGCVSLPRSRPEDYFDCWEPAHVFLPADAEWLTPIFLGEFSVFLKERRLLSRKQLVRLLGRIRQMVEYTDEMQDLYKLSS